MLPFVVKAQTWQGIGTPTTQRKIAGSDTSYRNSQGAYGYVEWLSKWQTGQLFSPITGGTGYIHRNPASIQAGYFNLSGKSNIYYSDSNPDSAVLKIERNFVGTAATYPATLTLLNRGDTPSGNRYNSQVHLNMQAGTTVDQRRYINFKRFDGTDAMIFGANFQNAGILYDGMGKLHRWTSWNAFDGSSGLLVGTTVISSGKTQPVEINSRNGAGGVGDTTGTGGLDIWTGGLYAANKVMHRLNPSGYLMYLPGTVTVGFNIGVNGNTGVGTTASAGVHRLLVVPGTTSTTGITSRGMLSQSANLFEAQTSTNSVVASISPLGNITGNSFIKSGGLSTQFLKADGSVDATSYAPLASPALTGTPTVPTATPGTNTTQAASTAFVQAAVVAADHSYKNGIRLNADSVKLGLDLSTLGTTNDGILTEDLYLVRGDVVGVKNAYIKLDTIGFGSSVKNLGVTVASAGSILNTTSQVHNTTIQDDVTLDFGRFGIIKSGSEFTVSMNAAGSGIRINSKNATPALNKMQVYDENNKGLEAYGNYEANYNSKSYVSKRYVDSAASSGTYTPTLTNTLNVTASTPIVCHYKKIGNEVTITGQATITNTGPGAVEFQVSLPAGLTSNLAAEEDLTGMGVSYIASDAVFCDGDVTTDRARVRYTAVITGPGAVKFSFTYTIIP